MVNYLGFTELRKLRLLMIKIISITVQKNFPGVTCIYCITFSTLYRKCN